MLRAVAIGAAHAAACGDGAEDPAQAVPWPVVAYLGAFSFAVNDPSGSAQTAACGGPDKARRLAVRGKTSAKQGLPGKLRGPELDPIRIARRLSPELGTVSQLLYPALPGMPAPASYSSLPHPDSKCGIFTKLANKVEGPGVCDRMLAACEAGHAALKQQRELAAAAAASPVELPSPSAAAAASLKQRLMIDGETGLDRVLKAVEVERGTGRGTGRARYAAAGMTKLRQQVQGKEVKGVKQEMASTRVIRMQRAQDQEVEQLLSIMSGVIRIDL